jgi:two-component system nitrate/nitrite sensor histidine kinase NarX
LKKISSQAKKIVLSRWFPWIIIGMILLLGTMREMLQPGRQGSADGTTQVWVLATALLGLSLVILVGVWLLRAFDQRKKIEEKLNLAEKNVIEAYQRLESISQISQQFVDASDENEVVQPVLKFLVEMVNAEGASFVPLDDHGQPQAAISHGQMPLPLMNAWVEYLATPDIRHSCKTCELETRQAIDKPATCPLLKGPFASSIGMLCLPVKRSEREFGIINLYLNRKERLDSQTQSYLRTLMEEMALGLESIRLRRRELTALRQFELVRQKSDIQVLLATLLENAFQTLDADCALLTVPRMKEGPPNLHLIHGDMICQSDTFIRSVLNGVVASGEPLLLGDVAGDPQKIPGVRSLIVAPLLSPDREVLGAILVGNRQKNRFHQRQLALLQTMAGQIALVVQNTNLVSEVSYKTMMQERARLAREIHDGLAQTLGFLKLQVAQLRSFLTRGEYERAQQNAETMYTVLSEAYQDARQAIDGLRISPSDCGLPGWLEQTAHEFSDLSGIRVNIKEILIQADLPMEYHAQLIRIVQEALSNVRKHSGADQVTLACIQDGGDLFLEIHDNGDGFSPDESLAPSQHGLKGMRERADLIGADFQVISKPGSGTIVRVRLPIEDFNEVLP